MRRVLLSGLVLLALAAVPLCAEELIQMGILLDTSSSMEGLIDQARTQLWKIVNELALARRGGRSPRLEVALYEYGNDGLPGRGGYIRQIMPLTTDLDRISEELFRLTTNGGSEYCGAVIQKATQQLAWDRGADSLKLLFIAGNEPFDQGQVDYRKTCRAAVARGITVNTIHCGAWQQGADTGWKEGAALADGRYMNIDQDQQVVYIRAPQDEAITRLGEELNRTYLAYGAEGQESKERQAAQDRNAAAMSPEAEVQRSVSKAQAQYSNGSWDLVDGVTGGRLDLGRLKKEELPEQMRPMTPQQRAAYVAELGRQRQALQAEVNRLNAERRAYVEEQLKQSAAPDTLGAAIIAAVREQAVSRNFQFGR